MRWVTRAGIHVDRASSAWLIRRFIDPEASFEFVTDPGEVPAGTVPFDMRGAAFGHHGHDCTFETLLRRHDLDDPVFWRIAEIIHEADLDDERFDAPEAIGVDVVLRGLSMICGDEESLTLSGADVRRPVRVLPPRAPPGQGALVTTPPAPETDRWRPLIDRVAPGLADDPQWPLLAKTLTRADAAGYDVEARLPELIARRPLPEIHAGRSLYYRLGNECPEAFEPIRSTPYEPPATTSTHPASPPDYARAFGNPSISRGGPRR